MSMRHGAEAQSTSSTSAVAIPLLIFTYLIEMLFWVAIVIDRSHLLSVEIRLVQE